ncbi:carbohydrate ABC transporter permease [Paenarthrobacter nitroguajacolicus]|uniref:carbohydrate ABC transporter permease n=1 Tax=Paenarthrobacter nitroguajacolicus TaxID=211146 RepID=UPI00285B6CAF|nr:carbohydrate ABC transporter permease [Paenarthrobacter nitroguajacolicus]MDR6639462.1 raffinose/stachyose/melibiose transport system permease protein [Paenarthrobacter nitroguajacolicus]
MHRYTKWSLAREILVVIASIILLLPFWILISTSLKTTEEVLTSSAFAPPSAPTFDNFIQLLSPTGSQSGNVYQGLSSSLLITTGTVLVLIALSSVAAYVFARSTRKLSNNVFRIFLIAIVLPTQLGVLPLYIGARNLGLIGNPWGMIIIYTAMAMPLAVFIYSGFFRRLPRDYEEAATIDGASRFQIFSRVIFPLMAPATGTVAILGGLLVWNDFFTAVIFLNGSPYMTLPVVVYNYVGSLVSQWNLSFAVVLIAMAPVLAFYVFAQKKLMQGYAGGIKS